MYYYKYPAINDVEDFLYLVIILDSLVRAVQNSSVDVTGPEQLWLVTWLVTQPSVTKKAL